MSAASFDGDFPELAAESHSRGLSWAKGAVSDVLSVDYYEEVISCGAPLGASGYAKNRVAERVDLRLRR